MILRPYVARENSLHDASYVYLTAEKAVLGELGLRVQAWATENLGPMWHPIFVTDPVNYKVKDWEKPSDAYYILKAIVKIPGNPLLGALKPHPQILGLASKVLGSRNSWAHYSQDEQMLSIKADIRGLVNFATAAGFDVATAVKAASDQLDKVTAGPIPGPAKPQPVAVASAPATTTAPPRRPRIGGAWDGELPAGEIELNAKLRDALDPTTGTSLRPKWPTEDLASAAIARWFALKPTTPRLRYDPRDGATVGFLEGFPYLFGYVGAEPETPPEQYRGFLGQTTYILTGSALVSEESGKRLAMDAQGLAALMAALEAKGIEQGEAFRVSNYNDLVHLGDEGLTRVFTLAG
jgi:hypothetical protein